MKNISSIVATLLLCCAFGNLKAQVVTKGSHNLYLGYVFVSSFKMNIKGTFAGPVVAGYRYAIGKRLTLGAELGYAAGKTDFYNFRIWTPSGTLNLTDRQKYSVFAVDLRFDYHYVNRQKVDIYSGITFGGQWENHKHEIYPEYNHNRAFASIGLSLIGCRYMITPKIGIYGELNIRAIGLAVLGVSARL